MRIFLACCALLLPLSALAGEELFTLQVEHYEDAARPEINARSLQGRRWDIASVIRSYQSGYQWVKVVGVKRERYVGTSTCIRVAPSLRRASIIKNLLTQLRMRQAEMASAGAHYQVIYPSNCGQARR